MKRIQERHSMPFPDKDLRLGFSGCVEFHGEDLCDLISIWGKTKIPTGTTKKMARRASQRKREHKKTWRWRKTALWSTNDWINKIQRHFGVWFSTKKKQ